MHTTKLSSTHTHSKRPYMHAQQHTYVHDKGETTGMHLVSPFVMDKSPLALLLLANGSSIAELNNYAKASVGRLPIAFHRIMFCG